MISNPHIKNLQLYTYRSLQNQWPAFYCTCLLISLCHFLGNCHKFIFICVGSVSRIWRIHIASFKDIHILGQNVRPYLHGQHEHIISLPFHEDRHIVLVGLLLLMILLHILTQSCSGCYLLIFWHRLIISAMKVCYYQTVGEVASLPSCSHWSQFQIVFEGIFVSGM